MTSQPVNVEPSVTSQQTKKLNQNLLKKVLVIIFIVIILLLLFILIIKFNAKHKNMSSSSINKDNLYNLDRPILIKEGDKYGYIDSNGKILIAPKYYHAEEFNNGYALVLDTDYYNIIDKTGKIILNSPTYDKPEYIKDYGIWIVSNVLYNSKLQKIFPEGITVDYDEYGILEYRDSSNNETGIANYNGKKIYKCNNNSVYFSISKSQDDDMYAIVECGENDSKKQIVSLNSGKVVYSIKNDKNYSLYASSNGIFWLYNKEKKANETYMFFKDNKLQYKTDDKVEDISLYNDQVLKINYGDDYEKKGKKQRYYYYNYKKKKIVDYSEIEDVELSGSDYLMFVNHNYKIVSGDNGYGLNVDNKIKIPTEYDRIEFLYYDLFKYIKKTKNQELVLAKKDGATDKKTDLINVKNKKIVASFNTNSVYHYNDNTFLIVQTTEENSNHIKKTVIYNLLTGKTFTVPDDSTSELYSNYVVIESKDGKKTFYNTKFNKIYESK